MVYLVRTAAGKEIKRKCGRKEGRGWGEGASLKNAPWVTVVTKKTARGSPCLHPPSITIRPVAALHSFLHGLLWLFFQLFYHLVLHKNHIPLQHQKSEKYYLENLFVFPWSSCNFFSFLNLLVVNVCFAVAHSAAFHLNKQELTGIKQLFNSSGVFLDHNYSIIMASSARREWLLGTSFLGENSAPLISVQAGGPVRAALYLQVTSRWCERLSFPSRYNWMTVYKQ